MSKEDAASQKPRLNRFVSVAIPQSKQIIPQDIKTAIKRRVSCQSSKTIKRPNQPQNNSQKKKFGFSALANYRIGTDVISFEMQEQRTNQMKAITNDQQLQAYYLAFKKLFTILYQACHILDGNLSGNNGLFQNKSIGFLCLIFQQPKDSLNYDFLEKMKPLVNNVLFLANNPNEFQRRIDLVARKVTLQNDKSQKIKNAFLNPKIQRTWELTVENCFSDEEIQTYVEDQFDTPEEKFCFIEIKDFIVNKLSTESFGKELRKYCILEQLDEDLSLDFKFEFFLAEEFSFSVPTCLAKDISKSSTKKAETPEESKCFIM